MNTRLVISIGNTHIRLGVFEIGPSRLPGSPIPPLAVFKILHRSAGEGVQMTAQEVSLAFKQDVLPPVMDFRPQEAVLLSVAPSRQQIISSEIERSLGIPLKLLSHEHFTDLGITYDPPQGMGLDRLAKIKAARLLFPEKRVIILDFGTALTLEVLDEVSYLGGMIIPGYGLSLASLHSYTEKLPRLTPAANLNFLAGSTEGCMRGGTFHLYREGVRGILEKIMIEFFSGRDYRLLVTGGDAGFFREHFPVSPLIIEEFNLIAVDLAAGE